MSYQEIKVKGSYQKAKKLYDQGYVCDAELKDALAELNKLLVAEPNKEREYANILKDLNEMLEGPRKVAANGSNVTTNNKASYVVKESNVAPKVENKNDKQEEQLTVEEALEKLNKLIGLSGVKKKVQDWVNQVTIFKKRKEQGMEVPDGFSYHLVFTGNPGTGKTTVARLMAQIYRALGILPQGQLIETSRTDLVAGFVGQTAIKTQDKINEALGGVLFVDEAYMLKGSGNDFGQEAIDTLLKNMEDHRDELIVIMAGYSKPMEELVATNSGLKSRFNNVIDFEDYTGEEMYKIFDGLCKKNQYHLSDEAEIIIKKHFDKLYANRDKDFGNARTVRNIFQQIVSCQSSRLVNSGCTNLTNEVLSLLTKEDAINAINAKLSFK